MIQDNNIKISIVIPIYNDEKVVTDCLRAIRKQTVKPHEVIVVDNNCTDKSIKIAKRFKFVRIIKEHRQGQKYAQFTGMNDASGDLIVRIDADTILPNNYVKSISRLAVSNPEVAGFTGYGKSRYEFIPKISIPWSWGYFTYTHAYFGHPILWGANMVVRKTYWDMLKKHLLLDDNSIHEDQDLSLALVSVGGKIKIYKDLLVSVQMEGMLHFEHYRRYRHMMKHLKTIDKNSSRYQLDSRLPKTKLINRIIYWLLTVWAMYGFYLITIVYSTYWHIKRFMLAH